MALPKLKRNQIVVATVRPDPNAVLRGEDLELPGAGLYEFDFDVPGWMLPDFDNERQFSVDWMGRKVTHHASSLSGNKLSVRASISDQDDAPAPEIKEAGAVSVRAIVGLLGVVAGGFIATQIANSIREVRKIVEVPAGGVLAVGAAVLAAGLGVAAFKR
jgi:hypothetical protein